MQYFPLIITAIMACIGVIVVIRIMKINESADKEDLSFLERYVKRTEDYLISENAPISVKKFLAIQFTIQAVLFAAGWGITKMWFLGLALFFAGFLIPRFYVSMLHTKNQEKFESEYKMALNHMAAVLSAGKSIPQAVEDTAQFSQLSKQQRKLFGQMNAMYQMGSSTPECFDWFAKKTKSKDAALVSSAIKLQTEIGGSEAKIMADIAETMQKRIKMRSDVGSALTESDMTVKIFDVAPFAVMGIIFLLQPQYMQYFFSSGKGFGIFTGIIGLMLFGSFVIRKMREKAMG